MGKGVSCVICCLAAVESCLPRALAVNRDWSPGKIVEWDEILPHLGLVQRLRLDSLRRCHNL